MTVVAKTGDGRDWLAELRRAQDIETFKDLVMEVALARPELKASVCELAREAGGEELKDWVARFFILSEAQPEKHNYDERPLSIVSWPSGLRLRRPSGATNLASALAANLNAALASKVKAAAPKPAPKPEPASSAEPEPEPEPEGKTVIASWEPSSLDLERLMVVFQSKDSFLLRYSNRFVSMEVPDGRGGSHGTRHR
jgi:hypothetical protein